MELLNLHPGFREWVEAQLRSRGRAEQEATWWGLTAHHLSRRPSVGP